MRAGGVAEKGEGVRVAAEGMDVGVDPEEGEALVVEAVVSCAAEGRIVVRRGGRCGRGGSA